MSREELVRKLDSTQILIEGGRLLAKQAVLMIVLFFIGFAIVDTLTYFTYQENVALFTDYSRLSPSTFDSKEHALIETFAHNSGATYPMTDFAFAGTILAVFLAFSLVYTIVLGLIKGFTMYKATKTYENMINVPENERVTAESFTSRIPVILGVNAIFIFLTGFLPVVIIIAAGYMPNIARRVVGEYIPTFKDENVLIFLSIVSTVILLLTAVGFVYFSARMILAIFVSATNKDASYISSFKIGRKLVEDDMGVIVGLVGIFMFIKAAINAYPLLQLYKTIAKTPTDISLESIILLAVIFIPLAAIIGGFETSVFVTAGVYLYRRYVSYEQMHAKVEVATQEYEQKKGTTLDTAQISSRTQEVGRQRLICRYCDAMFEDNEAYKEHLETEHTEEEGEREYITCEHCGEKFFRQVNYELHLSRDHPEEAGVDTTEITCEYCGKKIIGKPAYDAHLNIFHSAKLKEKEGQ
ncbi:MAG: C2H2-type zinc finger protein [Candidatus Odinarchaeota archaeon]